MKSQKLSVTFLFASILLISNTVYSQCSDAGVCSVGGHSDDNHANNIKLSYVLGGSGKPENVTFHTINLSGGFSLGKGYQMVLSIPFSIQSGDIFSTSGLGDLSILSSKSLE